MSGQIARFFLLSLYLASSLGAAGLGLTGTALATTDPLDGDAREFEEQVANDARGDVLLHWPGTVDLFYLTVGEVHSISLGESYMLMRLGYNVTGPGDEDIDVPTETPSPQVPDVPDQVPDDVLIRIDIMFNISHERTALIALFSGDYGRTWTSNQGRLVADNGNVDGHKEVLFVAPLRRFSLGEGDTMSAWNITAYRAVRETDTMEGFDPLNDPLPRYVPVHPLLEDPEDRVPDDPPLPLPPGAPGPPEPPEPPEPPVPIPESPVPIPEPTDVVPNDPYPDSPDLGRNGLPYGTPTRDELERWEPFDQDEPKVPHAPPVDTNELTKDPGENGAAHNVTHVVTTGRARFVARAERAVVDASMDHVGVANFSIESRFKETDQTVAMLVAGATDTRWLYRYGLDTPGGVKDLPAQSRIDMSFIAAPSSLFASPRLELFFIFISDWGGLDIVSVTYVSNTGAPPIVLGDDDGPILPEVLVVDMLNEEATFRINEARNLMFKVRDGEDNRFVSELEAVRAYVYPAGGRAPAQPYQLREKPWMDGVYETTFTFHQPGAWVIDLYFYDYPLGADGDYPNIRYIVRVDFEGESRPLVPPALALGSVGLIIGAIAVRERLQKSR